MIKSDPAPKKKTALAIQAADWRTRGHFEARCCGDQTMKTPNVEREKEFLPDVSRFWQNTDRAVPIASTTLHVCNVYKSHARGSSETTGNQASRPKKCLARRARVSISLLSLPYHTRSILKLTVRFLHPS
jgi:hypothetical protein